MHKVKINSLLYYQMFSDKTLSSLSFFVYLQKQNTSKRFFYKTRTELYNSISRSTKISVNSVHRHFKVLRTYGLITETPNCLQLLSKENQNILFNKDKVVIIPESANTLSKVKYFLKSLNFISNLNSQKKKVKLVEHLRTIKAQIDLGQWVNTKDFNLYKKAYQRGQDINSNKCDLRLSNYKGSKFVGKIKKTLINYKKELVKMDLIKQFQVKKVLFQNISYFEFLLRQRNDFSLKSYAYFCHSTQSVLIKEANKYILN